MRPEVPDAARPGCLRMLLTTAVFTAIGLFGLETWVDRWSWAVDDAWYRVREADDGTVTFGCQNFAEVQFTSRPAAGVTRILFIGGSSTFGFPERPTAAATATIPRARHGFVGSLQRTLDTTWPGRFELVNLGVNGGASEDSLRILRRAIGWGVSGVVIYDGHNEFMGVPSRSRPALWRWALYRRFAVLAPRTTESPGWTGTAAYGTSENAGAVVAQFRRNLAAMADVTAGAEVPLVLSTQASNLAGFQPSWSTEGPGESVADRPAGDLEALWSAHPASAEVAFALGNARLRSGGESAADAAFRAARDHDAMPFRATSAINDAVREVAAAAGATLVDADRVFSSSGPPGAASFHDWVHPTPVAAAGLADLLADGMARAGLLPARPGPAGLAELPVDERVQLETREAVAWLQWAMVRGHDPSARLLHARHHAQAALVLAPDDPDALAIEAVAGALLAGRPPPPPADRDVARRLAAVHPRLAGLYAGD